MDRQAARRSIIIFALAVLIAGALGAGLEAAGIGASPQGGLGMLIWLVLPALTAAGLITRAHDWRSTGLWPKRQVAVALAIALAAPLAVAAVFLCLSLIAGTAHLGPVGAGAMLNAALSVAAMTAVKNIFEEFSWRGFLTPRFARAGVPDLLADMLTGLIWWSWHLAYWFLFLPPTVIAAETGLAPWSLALAGLVALPLQAVFFGELMRRGGSFWAPWLAHMALNLFTTALITSGLVVSAGSNLALSPGSQGLGGAVALALLGLWLRRRRLSAP